MTDIETDSESDAEAGSTRAPRRTLGFVAVLVLAAGLVLAVSGWLRASAAEDDREEAATALDTEQAREDDVAEALAERRRQLDSAQGEHWQLNDALAEVVTSGEAFGAGMRDVVSIPREMIAAVRAEDGSYNEALGRVIAAQRRMLAAAEDHRHASLRLRSVIQVLDEVTRDVG